MNIDLTVAKKVLSTIDAGLVRGVGNPIPGQMCVEAAVCYALDLPHGDDPGCVSAGLRNLKITLNDSRWSSNLARTKGLRRLGLAQLGSKGALDEKEFGERCAILSANISVPDALRSAASIKGNSAHKEKLLACIPALEAASTIADVKIAAADAAKAAAYAADAADAAYADETLSRFAEGVVQILITMNAPGVQWLHLTEEEKT